MKPVPALHPHDQMAGAPPGTGAMPSEGIQGDRGEPKSRYHV